MRKCFLVICMLLFMLILMGSASADWFSATMPAKSLLSEHTALIGLGIAMVILGAYGRRTLSKNRSQD